MKRWLVRIGVGIVVVTALLVAAGWVISEPRPVGKAGPFADGLARRMMSTVHIVDWQRTGAIKWNFSDRFQHVWDKKRGYAQVKWKDMEVLLDIAAKTGIAKKGGQLLTDDAKSDAIETAYKRWVNDSFWLNPVAKFFDEGVTRELVELGGGKEALLVRYSSGGVTPGDAYLWYHDGSYLPNRWKMWVSVLPIGGIEVSFDRYQTLATGAMVSTQHDWLIPFELTDVAAAHDVVALVGEDPFEPLLKTRTSSAASQPAR